MEWVFLAAVFAVGASLLGFVTWRELPRGPLQSVELRFGADVSIEDLSGLLACIAGLPSNGVVVLDVLAGPDGIRHFLRAAPATIDTLRSQWRGLVPSLRMDEADALTEVRWTGGVVVRLRGRHPVLTADTPGASAALLGALQPLARDERLLLRWELSPSHAPALPSTRRNTSDRGGVLLAPESELSADHLRALRGKYAGPVLAGRGLVTTAAGHPKRGAHLAGRVVSAMRTRGGMYGQITVRRCSTRYLARALQRPGWAAKARYSPSELVGLVGLPAGGSVPGLSLGTAPLLMPSSSIPTRGLVLAASTWPGADRLLAQSVIGSLSNTLVCGPSGVGKSALICNHIVQNLCAGRGLIVLDLKGDLAADIAARVPRERIDDVIFLDLARGGAQPGLRVFGGADAEQTADLIVGVLSGLFADSWGPMSSRWMRAGLLLLAHDAKSTLADFPFVFSDHAFRRRLVARIADPIARARWDAFEAMGAAERNHQVSAPLGKVEELVGRRVIRTVVGQTEPALDMRAVMREGKVVIVSLAPGIVGAPAARLLAALLVHQFFAAVQARAAIAPPARTPYHFYLDEPAVLGDVRVPLDSLYELARGMGCGVLLSAQSLTQLSGELRAAATTNAATLIAFRQTADDARILSREFPGVSPEGLQNLGAFEVVMRIGLGPGNVTAPVSGRTLPPPAPTTDPEAVRRTSTARYGVEPAEVDAALAKRHRVGGDSSERPVGSFRSLS